MPDLRDPYWACIVLAVGCGGSPSVEPPPAAPAPSGAAREPSLPGAFAQPRVGNDDPRGAGTQPDYDAAALTLRERFEPVFRADGVPAAPAACAAMLDAAAEYYGETIELADERERALSRLRSTRKEDESACRAQTSPRAAACAATLLREREGELPWALDQCSRAFPRAAG